MPIISTSTGAFFERARQDMKVLRGQAETVQAQISSGNRLARSSDDPVAASQLRSLARSETLAKVDTRNAQRATGGRPQRQVADEPGIKQAVMRLDMGAGFQQRPEGNGGSAGHLRHRHMGKSGHHRRAARRILRHRGAASPEIERSPTGVIAQRIVGCRSIGRRFDIRREFRLLRAHRFQFTDDGVGHGLHRRDPLERIAFVKGALGQARKIEHAGLLKVDFALAQQQVGRQRDAGQRRQVGNGGGQVILEPLGRLRDAGLRLLEQRLELGRGAGRGRLRQRGAEPARGGALVRPAQRILPHRQQGGDVARFAVQYAPQRDRFFVQIASAVMRLRQQHRRRRIHRA